MSEPYGFKANFDAFDIDQQTLMDIIAQYLVDEELMDENISGHMFIAPRDEGGIRVIIHEGMVN